MKHDPADDLNVEWTHAGYTFGAFACDGKGLRQQVVEIFALMQAFLESSGLGAELVVGHSHAPGFVGADGLEKRP
jgi:hypothetical protein